MSNKSDSASFVAVTVFVLSELYKLTLFTTYLFPTFSLLISTKIGSANFKYLLFDVSTSVIVYSSFALTFSLVISTLFAIELIFPLLSVTPLPDTLPT